jgi:hypothetical protein
VQRNTILLTPARRRDFFRPNQDKPSVYSLCITIQIRDTQHKFTRWLRTLAGRTPTKLFLVRGCLRVSKNPLSILIFWQDWKNLSSAGPYYRNSQSFSTWENQSNRTKIYACKSTDLEADGHLDVGKNKKKGQDSQYKCTGVKESIKVARMICKWSRFLMKKCILAFRSEILKMVGESQQICFLLFLMYWKTHWFTIFSWTIEDALILRGKS